MKTKAAVSHSNHYIVLAFLLAMLALVISTEAAAAGKAPALKSKAPVLKSKTTEASKKPVNSVMFLNLKQRQMLAQNAADAALDAQLEDELINDSIPIAAPAEATSVSNLKTNQAGNPKEVALGASLALGTHMIKTSEGRSSYSGTYTFAPSISHAATKTSLAATLEYNREYSYELDDHTDGDWSNLGIKGTKRYAFNSFLDGLSFGPRLTIGMGNESRRQTFKGALGVAVGVTKQIGVVSLAQGFSYSYRHFEFDIRDNGVVNSPHSFDESTNVTVQVSKWMDLQATFGLSALRSFQGVIRTYSTTAIGANFALSKNASLGIGAATLKKNTLEPSGQGNRVKLWDSTDAVASLELSLSI